MDVKNPNDTSRIFYYDRIRERERGPGIVCNVDIVSCESFSIPFFDCHWADNDKNWSRVCREYIRRTSTSLDDDDKTE